MATRRLSYESARRRAESLIGEWGITAFPIDVKAIAKKHEIHVAAMPGSVIKVSGMLQRVGEIYGIGYATFVNNEGFQRFSIAHELGHFFLPGHPQKLLAETGRHESLAGFASGDKYELEADHFAAGLLMPNPLFSRAMATAGSGLGAIERLRDICETSLTATAIRYAECTDQAVAVVVSSGDRIDYWVPSERFKEIPGITWLKKADLLPHTATSEFNRDPGRVERCERQEAGSSILEWFGDGPDRELSEDVVGLGGYEKTMTVLFAEEWPDEDEEDDDDIGAWEPTLHRSRRK